ncbi:DUF4112 domain-containing protein [Halomonas campaniensis]|uniref:DUF4112 domain-containing protein n=2 Tax=Halomonas campaniensis TaxID=213554 RepID=UPI0035632D6F
MHRLARPMESSVPLPGSFRIGSTSSSGWSQWSAISRQPGVSFYIVALAAREGVPSRLLRRMVPNVALDTLIGSIPVLGDMFISRSKPIYATPG